MTWQNIERKLERALSVKVAFPAGSIWLPERQLGIDDWLESIAETDEEWRELEIPRIRFLQNHWPIDKLAELEWDDEFSSRRVIQAMYVGKRAYILFSDWTHYLVIAALEPKDNPSLHRAVLGKIFENRGFVPTSPTHIRNHRPELVPQVAPSPKQARRQGDFKSRPVFDELAALDRSSWKGFLSDVLGGWIGKWLNLPEFGFWHHEEMPESITRTNEGEFSGGTKLGTGSGSGHENRSIKERKRVA